MPSDKLTALSSFTPVLSDIVYGVDDPGGTPVKGKFTLTALRDLLQANLVLAIMNRFSTPRQPTKTIDTGVITVTGSYHAVDTEDTDPSDDLDTINGGVDGMRLVIRAASVSRTIVLKDGTGNLELAGDMSLDNSNDTIELIYASTLVKWLEISRSNNGA